MSQRRAVLSLCDATTHMAQPWADAGFVCFCVDIRHAKGTAKCGNLYLVGADILDWLPPREDYAAAFAFTPCTNLSVSGARWFMEKGIGGLLDGLTLFRRGVEILEWTGALWMAENPVSTVSSYFRKPDFTFDPCDYAGYLAEPERQSEAYTKKTCLWTGAGFAMPRKRPIAPVLKSPIHMMPPSEDRGHKRSATPRGFARAVFEANSNSERTSNGPDDPRPAAML
jgi:hypothetical protein